MILQKRNILLLLAFLLPYHFVSADIYRNDEAVFEPFTNYTPEAQQEYTLLDSETLLPDLYESEWNNNQEEQRSTVRGYSIMSDDCDDPDDPECTGEGGIGNETPVGSGFAVISLSGILYALYVHKKRK